MLETAQFRSAGRVRSSSSAARSARTTTSIATRRVARFSTSLNDKDPYCDSNTSLNHSMGIPEPMLAVAYDYDDGDDDDEEEDSERDTTGVSASRPPPNSTGGSSPYPAPTAHEAGPNKIPSRKSAGEGGGGGGTGGRYVTLRSL